VKAHKTSGGRKMPVRHRIPLGIVIFLVLFSFTHYILEFKYSRNLHSSTFFMAESSLKSELTWALFYGHIHNT